MKSPLIQKLKVFKGHGRFSIKRVQFEFQPKRQLSCRFLQVYFSDIFDDLAMENAENFNPNLQWHEYYDQFVDIIQKKDLDGNIMKNYTWRKIAKDIIETGEFRDG